MQVCAVAQRKYRNQGAGVCHDRLRTGAVGVDDALALAPAFAPGAPVQSAGGTFPGFHGSG